MIRVYHHIWPFGAGVEISERQKNRIYTMIKDDFTYHPNLVKEEENECHTVLKMIDQVQEFDEKDYILYIHPKGASESHKIYKHEWREFMELSIVDQYKTHIKMLDMGFDTSGVLMGIPHWSDTIYGGNFWWTTVKFINRIPKEIKENWDIKNRWAAEFDFIQRVKDWNPAIVKHNPDGNFNNFFNKISEDIYCQNANNMRRNGY